MDKIRRLGSNSLKRRLEGETERTIPLILTSHPPLQADLHEQVYTIIELLDLRRDVGFVPLQYHQLVSLYFGSH